MGMLHRIREAYRGYPELHKELAEMRSYVQAVSTGQGYGPFFLTTSGEKVNRETAMRMATWFTCLQVRWDSVGMLPFNIFKREGKTKTIASDLPAYQLLHNRPNPFMTATQFWKTVQKNRDNEGNAYCEIVRNYKGQPIRIDILPCHDVRVFAAEEVYFEYKGRIISSADMLHFKGYSLDGKIGLSLTEYHAETLGRLKAINRFSNRSISENPGIYGTSAAQLPMNDTQKKAFKDYWEKEMSNYGSTGQIPVLYNGFDLKTVGINPKDAAYLEQIQATKEDIYGITKVPPKLAQNYKTGMTYNNSEQQSLDYLIWTLGIQLKDIEEECNYKLFNEAQRQDYFSKFNEKAILRTDAKTQAEWLEKMFKLGAYNIDMILEALDENPLPNDLGQDHFVDGANLVPLRLLDQVILSRAKSGTGTPPARQLTREEIIELIRSNVQKNGHAIEE